MRRDHFIPKCQCPKAPSALTIFKRKRSCVAPDTAIFHTTTPKTISEQETEPFENALQSETDLKTMLFENADS